MARGLCLVFTSKHSGLRYHEDLYHESRCKTIAELSAKLDAWDTMVQEYEQKWDPMDVPPPVRMAALCNMMPQALYDNRVLGRNLESYEEVCKIITDVIKDLKKPKDGLKVGPGVLAKPGDKEGIQGLEDGGEPPKTSGKRPNDPDNGIPFINRRYPIFAGQRKG